VPVPLRVVVRVGAAGDRLEERVVRVSEVEAGEEARAQADHDLPTQLTPGGVAVGDGHELPLGEHLEVPEEVLGLHALGLAEVGEADALKLLERRRVLGSAGHDPGVGPGRARRHGEVTAGSNLSKRASPGRPATACSSREAGRATIAPQVPTNAGGAPTRHTARLSESTAWRASKSRALPTSSSRALASRASDSACDAGALGRSTDRVAG